MGNTYQPGSTLHYVELKSATICLQHNGGKKWKIRTVPKTNQSTNLKEMAPNYAAQELCCSTRYIHYSTEMDLYTVPFKPIKIFSSLRLVNVT